MLKRLLALRFSMLAQFSVLAALLMAALLYMFAIAPLRSFLDAEDTVEEENLIGAIEFELSRVMLGSITPEESRLLLNVERENPGFRYFASVSENGNPVTIQHGGGPVWRDKILSLQKQQMLTAPSGLQPCYMVDYQSAQGEPQAYATAQYCRGRHYYAEIAGVDHGVLRILQQRDDSFIGTVWEVNRKWITQAMVTLAVVCVVLFLHIRSLRRLAQIANSVDPKSLDHALPTERLPMEVLPLVQAVNNLIAKVAEARERERFFLSAAAHEMRTPLAALRTRFALLPEGEARDALERDLKRIVRLVDQLLRLMRLQGRLEYLDRVDLVALCRKTIQALDPLAQARKVELVFATECPEFPIWGNGDLVEVALSNLIENAISFTSPENKVIVAISDTGLVTVRDFGPGLSEKVAETVFQPFAKFPPNREGHGLGLAIVKAVADLHDAQVGAAQAEGGGALFSLKFERAAKLV